MEERTVWNNSIISPNGVVRILKSCRGCLNRRGHIHSWSTSMLFFLYLTRKSEWLLEHYSHSQTGGGPDKWRKRWKQTQRKNSNTHTTALSVLYTAEDKSILLHLNLLTLHLHPESLVSLFFHFSVSPSFGFYICVSLHRKPLHSPFIWLSFKFLFSVSHC